MIATVAMLSPVLEPVPVLDGLDRRQPDITPERRRNGAEIEFDHVGPAHPDPNDEGNEGDCCDGDAANDCTGLALGPFHPFFRDHDRHGCPAARARVSGLFLKAPGADADGRTDGIRARRQNPQLRWSGEGSPKPVRLEPGRRSHERRQVIRRHVVPVPTRWRALLHLFMLPSFPSRGSDRTVGQ